MRIRIALFLSLAIFLSACTKDTSVCDELPPFPYQLQQPPPQDISARIARNFTGCRKRRRRHLGYALFSTGLSVLYGLGIEKNPAKAFLWLKAAADKDHKDAKRLVGEMLSLGYGIPKDLDQARFYLKK